MTPDPAALRAQFAERHERPPSTVVAAPGRMVLLGDDDAASRLPLLAAPLGLGIALAAAGNKSTVVHVRSEGQGPAAVFARGARDAPIEAPWHRLVLAVLEELGDTARGYGAHVVAVSDLPAGAGLGAREAFTAGLAAALLGCWTEPCTDGDVARLAAGALGRAGRERQADDGLVAVCGQARHLLRIDTVPPAQRQLTLPDGLAFVLARAGEREEADMRAERVVGARIAAAMLLDQVGLDVGTAPRLSDVAGVDVVDVLVDDLPERISPREVARGVDLNVEHLVQLAASRFDPQTRAPVKRVARHLLGEAARVDEAEQALLAGDAAAFGAVLDASHDSLRQDYRVSTAAVDAVCAAMRRAGAYGARLLAPGNGSFAVAACPQDRVAAVAAAATAVSGRDAFEAPTGAGLQRL